MPLTMRFVLAVGIAVAAGCDRPAEVATNSLPNKETALPAHLFAVERPAAAVSLAEAKATCKAGDKVSFEARIGGRKDPFVEGRAIMLVADSKLKSCASMAEDHCPTPWDYCCESAEGLRANTATVRVVDGESQVLRASLKDAGGIAPLRTVIVTGTVAENSPAAFIVDATSMYLPPAAP
ncbi:MAG: hypothetical protein L0Z55_09145 [Planctomycetes bacterium]|nr:hypothetical protein [Planctomycetota bacterium]